MFFKKKSTIMFRNYDSFGYITDNRNFEYKRFDDHRDDIGDKIVSETGAIFLSLLGRSAKNIDEIAAELKELFPDIDLPSLKEDAREFYYALEKGGFIVSGHTKDECDEKDLGFSYHRVLDNCIKDEFIISKKSTQDFFGEYFNDQPQLTSLHIEITSKCNEKCLHCYIPHENKINNMPPKLFYNILDQCKNMKLLHLTISGGEPMLHKKFCDFLKKCREFEISVNVLSNLTLLNKQIIKEMKQNPLLGVQVSLYSIDPEIHDQITQVKGSCKKTKDAILKLIENDIPLKISCPILKQNKECYVDVIDWANNYKINVGSDFVIIGRYNHTIDNLNYRLSGNEVKDVIKEMAKNDSEYIKQIEEESQKKINISDDDFICSVCHTSICIADNGDIYPCAGWQDYILGNMNHDSLKEIWDNSNKVNYLRNLRRKDFPKCLHCSDKEFCTMCMVRNANEEPHGNPLVPCEYFCDIAKFHKSMVQELKKDKILN